MWNVTSEVSSRTVILGVLTLMFITLGMLALINHIGVERLHQLVEDTGPLAPLVYIILKVLAYILAPLSSGPIQLSSGLLFGFVPGVVYTMIGEVIGGSTSFLIARYLGRPIVLGLVGAEGMNRVDKFVVRLDGWKTLAYARVFLTAIYDFLSYAAGLTQTITLAQYVLVSAIAGVIPTTLSVALGAGLAENQSMVPAFYAGIGALALIPLMINWWLKRRRSTDIQSTSE